jgi:hypothetical protein
VFVQHIYYICLILNPKHEISSVDDFHFLLSIGSSSGATKSVERGKSRRTILFTSEGGQQC